MTDDNRVANDTQLREWARGMLPLEAATELLIRAGFAQEWRPWVKYDDDRQRPWIDFGSIPDKIRGMSGGEQRVLMFAASLGADVPIVLGDEIPGVDRRYADLMISAVEHAAGFTTPSRTIDRVDGALTFVDVPSLREWPPASM